MVAVVVLLKMVCMQNKLHIVSRLVLCIVLDALFNPGHRHTNRRGPRGPKETEISASLSDAKNPKRGSASYGAHEVRLLFSFFFSPW